MTKNSSQFSQGTLSLLCFDSNADRLRLIPTIAHALSTGQANFLNPTPPPKRTILVTPHPMKKEISDIPVVPLPSYLNPLKKLTEILKKHPPDLVIVDSLETIAPCSRRGKPDINNYGKMKGAMDELSRWSRENNVALMLVHRLNGKSRKNENPFHLIERVAGSVKISSAATEILSISTDQSSARGKSRSPQFLRIDHISHLKPPCKPGRTRA